MTYDLRPPVQVDTMPMEIEFANGDTPGEDKNENDLVRQDPLPAKDRYIGLKKQGVHNKTWFLVFK